MSMMSRRQSVLIRESLGTADLLNRSHGLHGHHGRAILKTFPCNARKEIHPHTKIQALLLVH
jgi:hypothetical protein